MPYIGTGTLKLATDDTKTVDAGTVQLTRIKNGITVYSSSAEDATNLTADSLVSIGIYATEAEAVAAGASEDISGALTSVTAAGTYYVLALGTSTASGKVTKGYYKVGTVKVNQVSVADIAFDPASDATALETDGNFVYNGSAHALAWDAEPTLTTALTIADGAATAGSYAYELVAETDYTASVVSMTEPKYYTASITGTGSFTGSNSATFRVEPGYFVTGAANAMDANLVVNGHANGVKVTTASATPAASGTSAGAMDATVITELKQAYGSAADPIQSVKFGNTPLVRDTDYTVTYTQTKDAAGDAVTGAEAKTAAPTEKGEYLVTVKAKNNARFRVANDTFTGTLVIGNGSFDGMTLTAESGTYLGGAAVEPAAADLALVNAAGDDVTATLGDKYGLSYAKWGGADELALYTTPQELAQFDEKYGVTQANPTDAQRIAAYDAWNKAALGTAGAANGKPTTAGDYKVTLTPTSGSPYYATSSNPNISGKFTVDPRVANEGSALGDLVIEFPDDAAYSSTAALAKPTVKMVVDPTAADDADKYVDLTNSADIETAYSQDGEAVANPLLEVGTYDATLAFSGNFVEAEVEKAGALTVAPAPIAGLATAMTFGATYFTGNAIVPVPAFSDGINDVTIPDGTSYELSYEAGTGTVEAGKPVGLGDYRVTATFSGNHTGILVGTLTVSPLDLANTQVQFAQGDGTFTTNFSALHTGSAVEPGFRVVLNAGQASATDEEPTEILPAAYQAAWDNNTNVSTTTTAGKATLTVSPAAAYAGKLTGSKAADFRITTYSFANVHAAPEVLKDGAVATEAGYAGVALDDLTFKITSDQGDLGFGTNYMLAVTGPDGDDVTAAVTAGASNGDQLVTLSGIKDAGDYTFTVTTGTDGRYAGKCSTTFEVNPIELSQADLATEANPDGKLTIEAATATTPVYYNGTEQAETFTVKYKVSDTITDTIVVATATTDGYAVEGGKATDAGEHAATFTFSGNYANADKAAITQTWAIQKFDISDPGHTGTPNTNAWKIYTTETKTPVELTTANYVPAFTGEKQEPAITLRGNDGAVLALATDATFTTFYGKTDADNTNAGVGGTPAGGPSVTVAGSGNYTGELTAYFAIAPVDAEDNEDVSIEWGDELAYTGDVVRPVPTITLATADGDYLLVEGVDYRVAYDGAPVNVGEKGTANIQFMGNFTYGATGIYSYEYEVVPAPQAIVVPASFAKTYGDAAFAIGAELANPAGDNVIVYTPDNSGVISVDSTTGNVTILKAGTARVTVSAGGTQNYDAAEDVVVTIEVAKAPSAVTLAGKTVTYNGKPVTVAATATGTSAAPVVKYYSDAKATLALASAPVNAGTYYAKATADADDNYAAASSGVVTIKINKAANTLKVAKATRTAKKVSKSKKTVAGLKVSKAGQGKVTYKKVSVKKGSKAVSKKLAKKITVNAKTGKITVKKGTAAGTYKVTVSAKAAGNANYGASKTLKAVVTLKVKA